MAPRRAEGLALGERGPWVKSLCVLICGMGPRIQERSSPQDIIGRAAVTWQVRACLGVALLSEWGQGWPWPTWGGAATGNGTSCCLGLRICEVG